MMKNLFQQIKAYALQGKDVYLVALLESEGSTPRNSGAYMLVGKDGYLSGTIGGGAMEYAAIQLAQKSLVEEEHKNFAQVYDLTPAAGLACGGSCLVQFCYLQGGAETLALAERVLQAVGSRQPWWLLLPMGAGTLQVAQELSLEGHRGRVELDGCTYYGEQYGYDGLVYVFGAGHVARELVPLLCHLGFRCVVFDDREEFADPAVFTMAEQVQAVDFSQLQQVCAPTAADYAVVMTRGHVYDAQCERFLLPTDGGYIGIMGSKGKAKLARELLTAEGFTAAQLARVTTPIGIAIGSETPAEIAVSIAAQLIQVRAQK